MLGSRAALPPCRWEIDGSLEDWVAQETASLGKNECLYSATVLQGPKTGEDDPATARTSVIKAQLSN